MYPESYKYTNDHEWIDMATGRMGVTDYAQKQLGDIVFLELPEVGKTVKKGEQVGSVESVKAVSEIFAPVSGKIVAVNELLADAPEKLNEDPHGAAWLVKIRMSKPDELAKLMTAAEYQKHIGAAS